MQQTRQQILDHLRVHRDASVRELGALLDLTATGVRQHLGVLEQEGYVHSREQRGRIGRPALRYSLTSHGEDSYPRQYDELANALIAEVAANFGADGLALVTRGVAQRLAVPTDVAPSASADERAETLTIALRTRGIVADWAHEGDAIVVYERTCPYPQVARTNAVACMVDVEHLSAMMGMRAELTSCIAGGDECCTYRFPLSAVPVAAS